MKLALASYFQQWHCVSDLAAHASAFSIYLREDYQKAYVLAPFWTNYVLFARDFDEYFWPSGQMQEDLLSWLHGSISDNNVDFWTRSQSVQLSEHVHNRFFKILL